MPIQIVPHARTLRKAREQVKVMVATGFSIRRIKTYLRHWALWWAGTVEEAWQYEELLGWFIKACWELSPAAAIAAGLLKKATGGPAGTLAKRYQILASHREPS